MQQFFFLLTFYTHSPPQYQISQFSIPTFTYIKNFISKMTNFIFLRES